MRELLRLSTVSSARGPHFKWAVKESFDIHLVATSFEITLPNYHHLEYPFAILTFAMHTIALVFLRLLFLMQCFLFVRTIQSN